MTDCRTVKSQTENVPITTQNGLAINTCVTQLPEIIKLKQKLLIDANNRKNNLMKRHPIKVD
jgi:hypothetical protein